MITAVQYGHMRNQENTEQQSGLIETHDFYWIIIEGGAKK